MPMTRLKEGLAEGGGNHSNGSKTIENQCLEERIVNPANVAKTIGKPGFEDMGDSICAQLWNTADIDKLNPEWMMHAENNLQGSGALPTSGGDWSGLNPPVMSSDKNLIGTTTNVLRR